MSGKCPKCESVISVNLEHGPSVNLEHGPIGNQTSGPLLGGYVALCSRCRTILGVLPDPDEIAAAVVRHLTKARG
jgi:hypothetical protein